MYLAKKRRRIMLSIAVVLCGLLGLTLGGRSVVHAACDPLATDKGQSTTTVQVEAAGRFMLWLRMWAPNAESDSVWVQVDNQCAVSVGGVQSAGEGFRWVNTQDVAPGAPAQLDLAAGEHVITLAGREAGAGVDRVMLVSDLHCVPIGFGDNCLQPPVKQESSTPASPRPDTPIWWLIIVSVLAMLAALGFMLWRYRSFMKTLPAKRAQASKVVVGTGLSAAVQRAELRSFLRNNKIAALVCGAVIVIGIVMSIVAASDGRYAFEVEATTLSGGAKVVDAAEASGGKYVVFELNPAGGGNPAAPGSGSSGGGSSSGGSGSSGGGGGGGSTGGGSSGGGSGGGGGGGGATTCPLPKYPTPSCTGRQTSGGYANTVNGNYTAASTNEVIDNWHIKGDLLISANNITIKNSQIDGTIYNTQNVNRYAFTVTDTTIGTNSTCIGQPGINDSNYTATRVRIVGHDDGFRMGPPGNVQVYDSFASFCYLSAAQAPPDGSHTDGVQSYCDGTPCSGFTVVHNTFDGRNGPATNMLNFTDGALTNVVATDNLLMDGAYVIDAIWSGGPNWTFTNNRIVDGLWAYAAVSTSTTCSHQTWTGNTLVTIDNNYNITSTVGPQPCVE